MEKRSIFNTVEEVVEDFREGKIVIVVDDEDRENEGDFIVAGEKILLFIRMKIPLDSAVEFSSRDRFPVPEKLDGKTDRFSAFAVSVRMIRFKGETLPGRGRLF